MPPVGSYALVLVVAAAVTALLTPLARWFSVKVGYVALPDDARSTSEPTPYGGGAAMFLGFLVAMMVAAAIPALHPVFASSSEPLGVVLAGAAIFAVGLIDDVRDMSAPAKVAGQVLAASILYFLGVTMYQFKIPLAGFIVLEPTGVIPLITALWVIALTNAVNVIDGLDGLAAGVVAIGSGALAVYGLRLIDLDILPADNIGPLVAVIACGICLGFLPFNFHPAKIFMGDAGALFLGLLMSASTMVIGGRLPRRTSGTTYFFFAPLLIPLFILGVPAPRHGLRLRPADGPGDGLPHPGQEPHPPPAAAPRPRPPPRPWSSCGPGRPCCRGSSCSRCSSTRSTPSSPSAWRRWPSGSTRSSIPGLRQGVDEDLDEVGGAGGTDPPGPLGASPGAACAQRHRGRGPRAPAQRPAGPSRGPARAGQTPITGLRTGLPGAGSRFCRR